MFLLKSLGCKVTAAGGCSPIEKFKGVIVNALLFLFSDDLIFQVTGPVVGPRCYGPLLLPMFAAIEKFYQLRVDPDLVRLHRFSLGRFSESARSVL